MGYDFFIGQIEAASVPFVSLNTRNRKKGDFLDQPFIIKDIGGLRVAILGLTGESLLTGGTQTESGSPTHAGLAPRQADSTFEESTRQHIILHDSFRTLEASLPLVKNRSDFIVLLSSLGHDKNMKITNRFPGIGLILGNNPTAEDGFVNSTLIANNKGKEGKKLGDIALTIGEKGEIIKHQVNWLPIKKSLADDKEARKILDTFYNTVASDETLWKGLEPRLASFDLEKDHANSYVGAAKCLACHKGIYKEWKKSNHADAYDTLVKRNRYFYPDCVSCHTTGAGSANGYKIGRTEHLQGIQCEVCHGPSSRHVESKGKIHIRKTPPKKLCIQCHDDDIAPDFPELFDDYLSMVNHSEVSNDLRTHEEEAQKPKPLRLPNLFELKKETPQIYDHLLYALSSGCRAKHLLFECKNKSAIEKMKYLDKLIKIDKNPESLVASMVEKYGDNIRSTEEQKALFRLRRQSVADALQKAIDKTERVSLDLFVMSYGSHATNAESLLYQLEEEKFKDKIALRLHFIATEVDRQNAALGVMNPAGMTASHRFKSKYGQKEIDEDIRQVLIQRYYPKKLREYLLLRNKSINTTDWKECALKAGIDPENIIRKIASGEGERLFAQNIKLANSKNITRSPTLFINGKHFKGKFRK